MCSWRDDISSIDYLNGCGPIYDGSGQTYNFLPFSNVVYTIASPAMTTNSFDTDFSNCDTPTYTVTYKNSGGSSISKPSWLTYNATL